MGSRNSIVRRVENLVYEILAIADVSSFTPTDDPDQGDTNYGLGQGILYKYNDPDDGEIIFQSAIKPRQGDYIVLREDQGGYRYAWLATKENWEGSFNVEPAPAS